MLKNRDLVLDLFHHQFLKLNFIRVHKLDLTLHKNHEEPFASLT